MRAVQFLVWGVVLFVLLLPLLRRRRMAAPRERQALRDELVKDPVCQTYIVRSRAVTAPGASEPPYFCSRECARRYAGPTRG